MSALVVDGLKKRYGGLTVTDDVSITVEEGEIHAVIGPNGAGKTTLVKQICGDVAPDEGSVSLYGRDVTHYSVHRRAQMGLGRTFQITCLLEGFTVLENVATALQAKRGSSFRFFRPVATERALNDAAFALIARVGLAERAGERVANLSHGEHRKLELAVALATEPKVLLLDEPLAGTGPEEVEPLIVLLGEARKSVPILLIDHDMHAVFSLAHRVTVLVNGRVIATGSPAEIRTNPAVLEAYLGEEGELAHTEAAGA
ncbi:ABC transporter ATP-binding protein [Acuticoccus mangrovi]|uniref:ABC transporter ATP-binding protein n=1 Tax=Acuticoccus mangrovi TaxID=2796142 RepID=A0A934IPB1_9HYPH|nr:ABC transporter ATP-binding protein [Acuticoccus mangrovi]MBJ3775837.1 ABC transporter ATP-binding protein [Acuticoccus mangrovi]